jgi:hypothetical protein
MPMSFVACLHAQAQQARDAAVTASLAPLAASAAAPTFSARPLPPRIMIAGGEKSGKCMLVHAEIRFVFHPSSSYEPLQNAECFLLCANVVSGKSSIAKILGNYAVRIGQKPVRRWLQVSVFVAVFLTARAAFGRSGLCGGAFKRSWVHLRGDNDTCHSTSQFRGQSVLAQVAHVALCCEREARFRF